MIDAGNKQTHLTIAPLWESILPRAAVPVVDGLRVGTG